MYFKCFLVEVWKLEEYFSFSTAILVNCCFECCKTITQVFCIYLFMMLSVNQLLFLTALGFLFDDIFLFVNQQEM